MSVKVDLLTRKEVSFGEGETVEERVRTPEKRMLWRGPAEGGER